MNRTAAAVCLAATLATPGLVSAREVTLRTELSSYGGDGAYVAIYLTDAQGAFTGTVWIAGRKNKYYKHLRDWRRLARSAATQIDGLTGASVGPGDTLTVSIDLADALIDAGYQIHIDTAVEKMLEQPSEVVTPLTSAGSGAVTMGKGYVKSFSYAM